MKFKSSFVADIKEYLKPAGEVGAAFWLFYLGSAFFAIAFFSQDAEFFISGSIFFCGSAICNVNQKRHAAFMENVERLEKISADIDKAVQLEKLKQSRENRK